MIDVDEKERIKTEPLVSLRATIAQSTRLVLVGVEAESPTAAPDNNDADLVWLAAAREKDPEISRFLNSLDAENAARKSVSLDQALPSSRPRVRSQPRVRHRSIRRLPEHLESTPPTSRSLSLDQALPSSRGHPCHAFVPLCHFYAHGRCREGENCSFSHSYLKKRKTPAVFHKRTGIRRNTARGSWKRNAFMWM